MEQLGSGVAALAQSLCVGGISARYTRFDRVRSTVGPMKSRKFIA
jgi:hypothetical protein